MITFPNTVLVASDIAKTAHARGRVNVLGQDQLTELTATSILNEPLVYLGVETGVSFQQNTFTFYKQKFSRPIILNEIERVIATRYKAPTFNSWRINGAISGLAIGQEYVVRIIYKDMVGHPGQFTQSYRAIAASTTTADLYTALAAKINNDQRARVTATANANVLNIVAKDVDDNEGLYSINEYQMVNMEVVIYHADRYGLSPVPGVTVGIAGPMTPGAGNWKIIRDREKWSLGYEGITNPLDVYGPQPDPFVKANAQYKTMIIEHRQPYVSPDNNYHKKTNIVTELYLPNSTVHTGADKAGDVVAAMSAWLASKKVPVINGGDGSLATNLAAVIA
jgi:hypothetical protein